MCDSGDKVEIEKGGFHLNCLSSLYSKEVSCFKSHPKNKDRYTLKSSSSIDIPSLSWSSGVEKIDCWLLTLTTIVVFFSTIFYKILVPQQIKN